MSSLSTRIEASRYLLGLEKKYPHFKELSKDNIESLIDQIFKSINDFQIDDSQINDSQLNEQALQDAEQELIKFKAEFSYLWCLAELQNINTQQQRGYWQTLFAELTIELALSIAWASIASKNKALEGLLKQHDGVMPGLFIFGMGKLGGQDLNFSSDVDLIAYFDPSVLPVPDMQGKSYVCHQVLQKLTQILNQSGNTNFIWRVDWRLRPNASATTLAMSTAAAQDYYYYRASPWHRLALMKARVIAGDKQLGQYFLDDLSSFIWRQNLDYRALDELAEIKQKINLEHPSLRTQRQWREPIVDEIEGLNIKLGSGCIREIEFIANALQLVWGGRKFELRVPNTVSALIELGSNEHIEDEAVSKLISSYQFLRRVENAIQMFENLQTHLIPKSDEHKQKLLTLLNIDSWAELVSQINDTRRFVNDRFEVLFADQAAAQCSVPVWPEELSVQAQEIIQSWEDGYHIYGVSNEVRHRLLPLSSALSNYLINNKSDVNKTVIRLHDFFRSLPKGEQYFRLLANSPELLDKVCLLYTSPSPRDLSTSRMPSSA